MDSLVLQVVVLYIAVCFGLSQSQGNHVFQPKIRKVSMTRYFHHLQLEWDVHGDSTAYSPETEIVFNIQVNQTEENRIVLNTNYSIALSKLKQPLEWSWDPLVPLQCEPQVIRIRSLVRNKSIPHSETWSDWSPWEAVTGLDTVDDNDYYIFPTDPTVKAGSKVTFCCIAEKTDTVRGFSPSSPSPLTDAKRRKVFHLENASRDQPNVQCLFSDPNVDPKGTQLNVIELPNKPKDFSCKTEETKLRCSWKTNETRDPFFSKDICKTRLILSDLTYTKTYCNMSLEEDNCSFPIGEEPTPNLRLTAKNCFGESYADYHSPLTLSVTDATKIPVTISEGRTSSDKPRAEKPELTWVILFLGIISLLLIICITFCAICCIRNRHLAKIPHPDVSPFLKLNSGTMEIHDVVPDSLEVMESYQTCTGKQPDLGMLIIENTTYLDKAYCLNAQEAESKNLNPPLTSYKPLQDFFAVSPPSISYKPLQDFFADKPISQPPVRDQDNFSYTSEMEVLESMAQLDDLPSLVEEMQPARYKPQHAMELETIPSDSDDNIHLRNTFTRSTCPMATVPWNSSYTSYTTGSLLFLYPSVSQAVGRDPSGSLSRTASKGSWWIPGIEREGTSQPPSSDIAGPPGVGRPPADPAENLMDSLVLRAVVLYVAVCFGPSQSQGSHVFQPTIQKVSMTKHFHRLQLEWDVHGNSTAYSPETEIVFNIQVNQTEENRIVLNTNYSLPLSKLKQPLEWSWDPLVPLQCEPQVIRIRSLVRNQGFLHSETWSDWSPWEAVTGLGTMDDNKDYVFPEKHIVKAGSNFTFCCIAEKTGLVRGFFNGVTEYYTDRKQRKVLFHLKDISQGNPNVICILSNHKNPGTYACVIELPNKPKNLSCETDDMITLRCSWKTNENKRPPLLEDGLCETELILSDVAYTKTYCKKKVEEDRCSFKIGEKPIPKLRLMAKNCFGEAHTDYDFYVTHRAPSGQLDIWRDIQPGVDKRNVTIFWKLLPDFHANGKIQAYEIQWEKLEEPTKRQKVLKPELNSTTIFLDDYFYKISVSAVNLINSSLPSVIIISRTAGNDDVPEVNGNEEDKISSTHEGIYVSWKPQNQFDGYIVDWCNYPKSHPCDFQWKKFGGNSSSAVIKSDAFHFNVSYTFRVYGSLNNMAYLLEKKALYLEEPDREDLHKNSTSVNNYYVYYNDFFFGILLLLVIVPVMLIICICFWKSSCIRKHYFPTIPQPDVSPFLKQNPGTMEICHIVPDKLEVMENHQSCTGKQSDLGMLIIENITYFDPSYHLILQEHEAESNTPALTSYKSLQDFFAISPPLASYKPLQDFFANKPSSQPPHQDQGNFNYLCQMKLPNSRVQQGDWSSSV
ncbi:uncharacterized protein [Tiliqua scincoides]|uniref:uncharacterized protein n=1 Tax=Tiliqua scincoides TaxID=71010 RepID=UPI0034628C06